ncbi:MAG: heavy metal translocating P-type ATPase, partial [Lacisediminihabitans sp.]
MVSPRLCAAAMIDGASTCDESVSAEATSASSSSSVWGASAMIRVTVGAPVVRLADRYAIPFTVVSLAIAAVAWVVSGDP